MGRTGESGCSHAVVSLAVSSLSPPRAVFALGWDSKSVILKVIDYGANGDLSYDTAVQTYRCALAGKRSNPHFHFSIDHPSRNRLPKASHAYDHLWTTEWPRIREVESERYLIDMHGMFYELAPFTWVSAVPLPLFIWVSAVLRPAEPRRRVCRAALCGA